MLNYGLLHESSIKINFLIIRAFKNIEREFVICCAISDIESTKRIKPEVDGRDNIATITMLTKQLDFVLDTRR